MPSECILPVKVSPNASRSEVTGWLEDTLKIRLKAPPVDGKANTELCRFLAASLDLPKNAVTLISGTSTRQKRVRITGLTLNAIQQIFPRPN
jgi:uncharacterized protein (TIGR00251 family)